MGLFICHCGDNIKGAIDIGRLKNALNDENLIFMEENPYLCSVDGQKMMQDRIKLSDLDGIVVAACSPEIHQEEFRAVPKQPVSTGTWLMLPTYVNSVPGSRTRIQPSGPSTW